MAVWSTVSGVDDSISYKTTATSKNFTATTEKHLWLRIFPNPPSQHRPSLFLDNAKLSVICEGPADGRLSFGFIWVSLLSFSHTRDDRSRRRWRAYSAHISNLCLNMRILMPTREQKKATGTFCLDPFKTQSLSYQTAD